MRASQDAALLFEGEARIARRDPFAAAIADVDEEIRLEPSIGEESGVDLRIVETGHGTAIEAHGAQREDQVATLQGAVAKTVDFRLVGRAVPVDRVGIVI